MATTSPTPNTLLLASASKEKLEQVADALKPWLLLSTHHTGTHTHNTNKDHHHEEEEEEDDYDDKSITAVAAAVVNVTSSSLLRCRPCQSLSDTIHYRCKCSFQIIVTTTTSKVTTPLLKTEGSNESPLSSSSPSTTTAQFAYAIRQNSKPVLITEFPPANHRISQAMRQLLEWMNGNCDAENANDVDGENVENDRRRVITDNLTSVTFVSSWNETECFLMLHYSQAIIAGKNKDVTSWQHHAVRLCERLNLQQVTGHSKKIVLKAYDTDTFIHDTIWLTKKKKKLLLSQDDMATTTDTARSTTSCWDVQLSPPPNNDKRDVSIAVHYQKPATAFFHPSAPVMCSALAWMLDRISGIAALHHQPQGKQQLQEENEEEEHDNNTNLPRLLELYCGCGAHTMALAKSGLLRHIVAVELDERLVQAAITNRTLNQVQQSVVTIDSSDAGQWARRFRMMMKQNKSVHVALDENHHLFDILLVDPPRQGLDEDVCCMARAGSFEHFLYISCGRDALIRDLERLASDFFVVDCTLLDLFPGTYSVESLVHLRRRSH